MVPDPQNHGVTTRHGAGLRGQRAAADADLPAGRFGQMFGLPAAETSPEAINHLVGVMKERGEKSAQGIIPAGFTYLGQFVDHDITFDASTALEQRVEPNALVNFRTPRLDLDSLYGSGPQVHPYLYDWCNEPKGTKLLVGRNTDPDFAPEDLPRNQQGRALVGDRRNDENLIICQLHLLFIRFHNAVIDHLTRTGLPETREATEDLLDRAQRTVRWHYQWLVLHDFLPRIRNQDQAKEVLPSDAAPRGHRKYFKWKREPFIPVEFSGAAYRFGHSMVRNRYDTGPDPDEFGKPIFPTLDGRRWLPADSVISWKRFFEIAEPEIVQKSQTIDTAIVEPLCEHMPDDGAPLPFLNLKRGWRLKLPSGQAVARKMGLDPLNEAELDLGKCDDDKVLKELVRSTPLWYYILAEAAKPPCSGERLGPVGSRIVAEVLLGLIDGDQFSYLNSEKPWAPRHLGAEEGHFTMVDLVHIAELGISPDRRPAHREH